MNNKIKKNVKITKLSIERLGVSVH